MDHDKTLWTSWAIEAPAFRFYFAGDTGYSATIFQEIGRQFGGFDAAFLPIGGYAPREIMAVRHVTPAEAITVGQEVGASVLIAMHWGTIENSDEPFLEPAKGFRSAAERAGLSERTTWLMKVGETRAIPTSKVKQGHMWADECVQSGGRRLARDGRQCVTVISRLSPEPLDGREQDEESVGDHRPHRGAKPVDPDAAAQCRVAPVARSPRRGRRQPLMHPYQIL